MNAHGAAAGTPTWSGLLQGCGLWLIFGHDIVSKFYVRWEAE